jgi:hypothetical protein
MSGVCVVCGSTTGRTPVSSTASNQLKSFLNIKCRLQKVTKRWKEEKKPMQFFTVIS